MSFNNVLQLSAGLLPRTASLPVQLAWKSKGKKWLFTANYAYERGMNSMGKVGTELAKNPFGYSNLIESNQYGHPGIQGVIASRSLVLTAATR